MSEKRTSVEVPGAGVVTLPGHVQPGTAVAEALRSLEAEQARTTAMIAGLRAGDGEVYHQRGAYRVSGRVRVDVTEDTGG